MKKKRLFLVLTPLVALIGSSMLFVTSCGSQSSTTNSGTVVSPSTPKPEPTPPVTAPPSKPEPSPPPTNPDPSPPVSPPPSKPDPIPPPTNPDPVPPVTPPPSKPDPTPPPKPNPSIDVDNVKRTINVPYLQNVIKTNDMGYNPDSFQKTILKYQTDKNTTFLSQIFTDKSISNWESIKDLNVIKDDAKGTASLSFSYGGTHKYNVDLTSKDGLLPDSYYYEKMDDLSFAFRISYASVVSGRNFPVLNSSNVCVKNQDAMNEAGYFDNTSTNVTKKGTFLNGYNRYVRDYNATGSGWLVDYLPSTTPGVQDFYEFVVATNVHVANLSGAFYYYNDNTFRPDKHYGLALDPIYIKTSWAKHKGNLDYNNPNSFDDKNLVGNYSNFDNLSFQTDLYSNGDRNNIFLKDVIKNMKRQSIPDSEAFSSWDHPLSDKAKKEKQSILKDYSFYSPEYTLRFDYPSIQGYWKEQLNNPTNSIKYTNIQPDLTFVKTKFSRSDLETKWPKLLKAIEENKMDSYLVPLKKEVMNPLDNIFYYYAGNPQYGFEDPKGLYGKHEKLNGYDSATGMPGNYYRSGKIEPHVYDQYGGELKFNTWPNDVDIELANPYISGSLSGYNGRQYAGPSPHENEYIDIFSKQNNDRNMWYPFNQEVLDQTYKKFYPVNTNSEYLNSLITRSEGSLLDYAREYFAASPSRGMIKKTYDATKKYWWGTSEYILGGNSGSIVLSPKLEIGGIISSKRTGPDVNMSKQGLIESAVNPAENILTGAKIISDGVKDTLVRLNLKSALYNKKNI